MKFYKIEPLKNCIVFTFETSHGDGNICVEETFKADIKNEQILDVISKYLEVSNDIEEKNTGEKDDYDLNYDNKIVIHGITIPVYEDCIHEGDKTGVSLLKVIKHDENGEMFELDLSEFIKC